MSDDQRKATEVPTPNLPRWGRFIERPLAWLSAFLLFAMMVLTFVDVTGRYVFSAPLPGGFETIELMMGMVVFAALPLVTADQQHVTVSLFDGYFVGLRRRIQQVCIALISAAFVGAMTWRLWAVSERIAGYGDYTPQFHIPIAPVGYLMTACGALTTIILLAQAWGHLTGRAEPAPGSRRFE